MTDLTELTIAEAREALAKKSCSAAELNQILHWIEQLNAVDVEGVEPLTSVVEMEMKQRDDEVTDGECPEDVLANAPAAQDHYFVVPKVVE